uniref:cytochrome c oxidase subunit II n=1 Tax=Parasacculina shiinoi TaxID=2836419 RepID=UPI002551FE9A|nr:cytochrome c oxidase subunit II [Parasacculina shiinoi]WGU20871.1 cytochrome c oxidase subunit II [Parasacculina shiinoi]
MVSLNFGFQDSCSHMMHEIVKMSDFVNFVLFHIALMSLLFIIIIVKNLFYFSSTLENDNFEFIWTLFPLLIMVLIGIPSMYIMYLMEGDQSFFLTVKVLGNQWYWFYEYFVDGMFVDFDSYILGSLGESYRLLEVDNRLVVPSNLLLRFLVSSLDVIHSFTVPSLGFKIDAVPGRVNQISFSILKCGVFYGQCSEICGVNHSYMPVVIESVSINDFLVWFMSK